MKRWIGVAEISTGFAAAGLFVLACHNIPIDPLDRLGQVSGLAYLGLRFLVAAVAIAGGLIAAIRLRGGAAFPAAGRIACAAIAGLTSGFVASGILVALHGTRWGLGGEIGDTGTMIDWANELLDTGKWKGGLYPPLQVHLIAWFARLFDTDASFAIKHFQVFGVAITGPLTYACWRLHLRPGWALGIGVTAALPLIESYRPYPSLVLMVFVPLALKFLQTLRDIHREHPLQAARWGLGFGAVFGILFLLYSGWFFWSAPGFAVALLVLGPWRRAPGRCAVLCGFALLAFVVVALPYLTDVAHVPSVRDDYVPFDATVEPMYIAMWRGGLPGKLAELWPPIGELGGVGGFSVLVIAGFGAAIALGRSRTVVIGASLLMVGCWLLRLWFAHDMWKTKLVQLYTRTSYEILYCLLVLGGYALYLAVERAKARAPADSPLRSPWALVGVLCAALVLYPSAASAIADRYMPRNTPADQAWLGWQAHTEQHPVLGAAIEVSSSHEGDGFAAASLTDRSHATAYESAPTPADHDEWIAIRFPLARTFSKVVLYPARDAFPTDFTIDVWDAQWITRVTRHGYAPTRGAQVFDLGRTDVSTAIRIHVTKLVPSDQGFLYRLAEIDLIR